uniref:Uncharacterized protein n=1 Tax=Anguilla anguilla TaxID=7936 RepID=A0A0E9U5F7_ANGAN
MLRIGFPLECFEAVRDRKQIRA